MTIRTNGARPLLAALCIALPAGCLATEPAKDVPATAAAAAPKSYDRPGFVTVLDKHGRLWVFREGAPELAEFREKGELARQVVRPRAGPDGRTLKAPDAETIEAYLALP